MEYNAMQCVPSPPPPLLPLLPSPFQAAFQGGYDSKVTSARRGLTRSGAMGAWAVNGPTDERWPGGQARRNVT